MIVIGLIFVLSGCDSNTNFSEVTQSNNGSSYLPKALFLTTGTNEGNGKLPHGAVLAIQALNRLGVPVQIETRDILLAQQELDIYNIIILMSAIGYHDADRQYSLTYMSDDELENLRKFVEKGGVLIAGDNIGRNYTDGTDRISVLKVLTPDNWPLSECFGISMEESNMKNYTISKTIKGLFEDDFRPPSILDNWTLVASKTHSKHLNILASWVKEGDSIPAMIQNRLKFGTAYLLPSSYYLHPANDGGYWSASQIQSFYDFVVNDYKLSKQLQISLNPWPNGYDYAFSVSLNSEGSTTEFERINSFLREQQINPVYFVGGNTSNATKELLLKSGFILASNAFSKSDFTNISYPLAKQNILLNQNEWNTKFTGFRFPYTRPGFWGLFGLSELDYQYESSIGAENLRFFHGSVVPYNIPISFSNYYSSTNIMEISPTYHDDYYFLSSLLENEDYSDEELQKDVRLYSQYLMNFWDLAVKPYNGQMTFLGHPAYSGYSDSTLIPLSELISHVKKDKVWMSSIEEIAQFRNGLNKIQFEIKNEGDRTIVIIHSPIGLKTKGVSLKLERKPKTYTISKGTIELKKFEESFFLVFDASNKQNINIEF